MNVMCSSGEPTYCNRRPFVSEDGCDRGNVDIHQFDDLPYCEVIDPTSPDIPPEVVDTPINLPVPPPCSCVNFDFNFPVFKYHRDRAFSTSASFRAEGDCCEGNYTTDFKIKIPCPVIGNGQNKIAVGVKYGTGKKKQEKTYITKDDSNCTVTPEDVDIDLEIPCPANVSGYKKISAEGRWAKAFSEASARFVNVDGDNCNIEFLENKIDLDIECPISGRGDNKISAEIRYGDGGNRDEKVFMRADPAGCNIEGVDAGLSLQIPCPVKSSVNSKIKVGIGYGDGFKSDQKTFIRAESRDCAIVPEDADLNLQIPCPLDGVTINGENGIVVTEGGGSRSGCNKEFTIAFDAGGGIEIPCPITGTSGAKKLKMSIKVADASGSNSATYMTLDTEGCGIDVDDETSLHISVPCPVSLTGENKKMHIGFDTIKYDGMAGAFDTIGGLDDLGWSGIGISSCKFTLNNKVFRLKALPPTNTDRLHVTTTCTTTADASGSFSCDDSFDSAQCRRNLNFRVKFPSASAYGTFRVEGDKITHCHFYAAHGIHTVINSPVTISDDYKNSTWYLNVPHDDLNQATVDPRSNGNDDDNTSIKLFRLENYKVVDDYRGMPFIPIYA